MILLPVTRYQVYAGIIKLNKAILNIDTNEQLIAILKWRRVVIRQAFIYNLGHYVASLDQIRVSDEV